MRGEDGPKKERERERGFRSIAFTISLVALLGCSGCGESERGRNR